MYDCVKQVTEIEVLAVAQQDCYQVFRMLLSIKAEVVCLDLSPFPVIFKFVTIIPFVQQELILFHCMWR